MPDKVPEVSVVMPCLNEAETIAACIEEARESLSHSGLTGEIIVADNNSTDDSVAIATAAGARVVIASPQGYGVAMLAGIRSASSEFIVMCDADGSYDLRYIPHFIEALRAGNHVVIGNRFQGGVAPGAMPWLHRWVGNPVLSAVGRILFRCSVGDFHCGIRAIRKGAFDRIHLRCTGMEFASEMIVRAELAGLQVAEIPTVLRPDKRSRAPHLRSFRDGWRHLKFMIFFCPRWLFFIPGFLLLVTGVILQVALMVRGGLDLFGINYGVGMSLVAVISIISGYQLIASGIMAQRFGQAFGALPTTTLTQQLQKVPIESGILFGVFLGVCGIGFFGLAFYWWKTAEFGDLIKVIAIRWAVPAVVLIVVGVQTVWASLTIGVLEAFASE